MTDTNVHEISDGIFRISTPLPIDVAPDGFTFNQYLVVDDEPLLFHTGPRRLFPKVRDAVARAPRALADGETLSLGTRRVTWLDTPHVPHAWECGFLYEAHTRTLLCGDLFTQGGNGLPALTEADILGPSEAFRRPMDYYSHTPDGPMHLDRLAALGPRTLACMHGSAWRGDGAALLRELARALGGAQPTG